MKILKLLAVCGVLVFFAGGGNPQVAESKEVCNSPNQPSHQDCRSFVLEVSRIEMDSGVPMFAYGYVPELIINENKKHQDTCGAAVDYSGYETKKQEYLIPIKKRKLKDLEVDKMYLFESKRMGRKHGASLRLVDEVTKADLLQIFAANPPTCPGP